MNILRAFRTPNVLAIDPAPVVGKAYMVPTVLDVWGRYGEPCVGCGQTGQP